MNRVVPVNNFAKSGYLKARTRSEARVSQSSIKQLSRRTRNCWYCRDQGHIIGGNHYMWKSSKPHSKEFVQRGILNPKYLHSQDLVTSSKLQQSSKYSNHIPHEAMGRIRGRKLPSLLVADESGTESDGVCTCLCTYLESKWMSLCTYQESQCMNIIIRV